MVDSLANATSVIDVLRARLAARGIAWDDLWLRSEQLVLFGSRAAGVAREGSDYDLLSIGSGQTVKALRSFDLVVVSAERSRTREWLGSELAGHVARYGVWLRGEPTWVPRVWRSDAAVALKADRLKSRISALDGHLERLGPGARTFARRIRRDLQRHQCLRDGLPVPPTAHLDEDWARQDDPRRELIRMAVAAGVQSSFLAEQLTAAPLIC